MTNPNNLYNILAAFNKATKTEAPTVKQVAQKIYESVESKGSIMGGVKGVEKKLSEAYAAHKVNERADREDDEGYARTKDADEKANKKYDPTSGAAERRAKDARKAAPKKKVEEYGAQSSGAIEALNDQSRGILAKKKPKPVVPAVPAVPNKKVAEGKVKQLAMDLEEMSAAEFLKKYKKSKAEMRKSMRDDIAEGIMDEPETTDTPTGRIHRAKPGGYGLQDADDIPQELNPGQVARGRGRPKGLPAMLRAKKAAELAAQGGDTSAPRGRGRPKAASNTAPIGSTSLASFFGSTMPNKLPGKTGVRNKMSDAGTEKGRVAKITGEGSNGAKLDRQGNPKLTPAVTPRQDLGGDFADMARGMKNKDGTPRFKNVSQGQPAARPPTQKAPRQPSTATVTGPAAWYDQSTGGKRNMGDSKIPRKAAMAEGRSHATLKGYLAEATGSGNALDHIEQRYKNEVKRFAAGEDMDQDLYEALFDYYSNSGEMPYGTMKARTGDPYEWVCDRFEREMHPSHDSLEDGNTEWHDAKGNTNPNGAYDAGGAYYGHRNSDMEEAIDPLTVPAYKRKAAGQDPMSLAQVRAPRADSISDKRNLAVNNGSKDLDDLARLAGITTESVSVIGGDIDDGSESKMNISTNQSSDGTKNVTVTADGEAAVALLSMLKMAGMGDSDAAHEQGVIIASQGEEECDMEMEEEYANEPAPAYQSVDATMSRGDDMNREKKQDYPLRAAGNNPMAGTEQVDELSKNTLGSYAKKANIRRGYDHISDHESDTRGAGVMRSLNRLGGDDASELKGKAMDARWSHSKGLPDTKSTRQDFEQSVDKYASESTDPVKSMGRDLMAEYQAMKIKK